ncbi:hypothetical protein HRbin22_01340 [Candidatus Thermoflexus japonica]|uniref:Uncharacterized protein n=1 Tax=Candidatus Thermoflexus japonica TaxID=2035417 RepID=A0A2H5Y6M2_9CHLR|nr:hypothetical protein HRbin22_01340 [Candidatus Thermoflexus japonica]
MRRDICEMAATTTGMMTTGWANGRGEARVVV